MPLTWANIPREILRKIFKELKNEYHKDDDLKKCSLVCRGWVYAAQEILFSTVTLRFKDDTEKLIETVARNPSLVGFVKTLHYHCYREASYSPFATLAIFANFFPNLKKFKSPRFVENSFYEMFCDLVKGGKFRSLIEFPNSHNKHQDELRASCLISHGKNSITKLTLICHDDLGRNDYRLLCGELSQFSKLEELEIKINSRTPQSIIQYIESVNLVTAEKLRFSMDFPELFDPSAQDLKNVQPTLQVKKFSASLPINISHAKFILYLMKKLPTLEDLQLRFADCTQNHLTELDSANLLYTPILSNQFFMYLSRISKYSFIYSNIDRNDSIFIIEQYINGINFQKKATLHLNLILSLRGGRTVITPFMDINLCRSERTKTNEISVQLFSKAYGSVSFGFFLENFGDSLDTMRVTSCDNFDVLELLHHVSRYCPNLKSLVVEGSLFVKSIVKRQILLFQGSCHLKELVLHSKFPTEIFLCISQLFPSVEILKLHGYAYHTNQSYHSANMPTENCKTAFINMFTLSVKHLVMYWTVEDSQYEHGPKHVYMKINTRIDRRTRYFHIIVPDPTKKHPKTTTFEVAKTEYHSTIGDKCCVHHEISCKSLEKITLTANLAHFNKLVVEFYLK